MQSQRRGSSASTPSSLAPELRDRLNRAFASGGHPPADYLASIRINWNAAESSLRRTTLSLLITAALFELLAHKGITEISIGPIKATDLTLIRQALPPVFAYLSYEWVALGVLINRLGNIHDTLIEKTYPALHEQFLHVPLAPAVMSLASEVRLVGGPGKAHNLARILNRVKTSAFLCLLLSAQIYFFYRDFDRFGFGNVAVLASLLVTILILPSTILYTILFVRGDEWT